MVFPLLLKRLGSLEGSSRVRNVRTDFSGTMPATETRGDRDGDTQTRRHTDTQTHRHTRTEGEKARARARERERENERTRGRTHAHLVRNVLERLLPEEQRPAAYCIAVYNCPHWSVFHISPRDTQAQSQRGRKREREGEGESESESESARARERERPERFEESRVRERRELLRLRGELR